MQKQTQNSNLECVKSSTGLGRKSLLACAVLAMVAGGNAWAAITSDDDQLNGAGNQIVIDDNGLGGNEISLDANQGTISVTNGGSSETLITGGSITADSITLGGSTIDSNFVNNSNALHERTQGAINTLGRRIDDVAERSYGGIASVAALAAIPSPAAGKRFSVGVGAGNYSSENALAVGFRAALTESTSVTAGVSRNTASKTVSNIGVGYSW